MIQTQVAATAETQVTCGLKQDHPRSIGDSFDVCICRGIVDDNEGMGTITQGIRRGDQRVNQITAVIVYGDEVKASLYRWFQWLWHELKISISVAASMDSTRVERLWGNLH